MGRRFPTPEEIEAERERLSGPDADRELEKIRKKLLSDGTENTVVDLSYDCTDAVRALIHDTLHEAGYFSEFGAGHDVLSGYTNWIRIKRKKNNL